MDHRLVIGAVLGAPGIDGAGQESLSSALVRVSEFGSELVDEYHESLVSAVSNGHESVELAECIVVLGLADPEIAARRGLDIPGYAAWAAREHVREGRPDRAVAIAELATGAGWRTPELAKVEEVARTKERSRRRAIEQLLLNARRAHAENRIEEARHHLMRLLELDPENKDAPPILAGLDEDASRRTRSGVRFKVAAVAVVALGLPIGAISMAQVRASQEYDHFARPVAADLLAVERRIDELERFADAHPLWWGRATLVQEVSILTQQRDSIEREIRERNELEDLEREAAGRRVDDAYADARTFVETGHADRALALLEQTLAAGVPSASQRARLRRDIAAIRELLASGDPVEGVGDASATEEPR
ncbi:MAG: hypothetical protein R3F34_01625 [Planctomycetota bacterium]